MLKEALTYLQDNLGKTVDLVVNGETYFVGPGPVTPVPLPVVPRRAEGIKFFTLSSMARFVVANVDRVELDRHFLLAKPSAVRFFGPLDTARNREMIAIAEYVPAENWLAVLNQRLRVDVLAARLACLCDAGGDKERLINLLDSVQMSDTVKQKRLGLGFRITAESGVDGDGWTEVSTPSFVLHPFRAFTEAFAQQPGSVYFLDVQVPDGDGPKSVTAYLTLADGEQWEQPAAEKVAEHLSDELQVAAKEIDYDGPFPQILY